MHNDHDVLDIRNIPILVVYPMLVHMHTSFLMFYGRRQLFMF